MSFEDDYRPGNPDVAGSRFMTVLSGCSGGGKSTLLEEMARRGFEVRPEAGRQIVKEQMHVGGDGLPWVNAARFIDLAVSRAMWQFNTAVPGARALIFDRALVDVACYFEHIGLPVPADMERAMQRYRYADRVFMTPPWEDIFKADAERQKSFDDAILEYRTLGRVYRRLGYEIVELPKLPVSERADVFERHLAG